MAPSDDILVPLLIFVPHVVTRAAATRINLYSLSVLSSRDTSGSPT